MNTPSRQVKEPLDPQGQMGAQIMNEFAPPLPADSIDQQTELPTWYRRFDNNIDQDLTEYDELLTSADEVVGRDWSSATALYSFSLDEVQQELEEIREEVEETCAAVDDASIVPESAYDETVSLLEQMQDNIPIPDMMWLEDGGIGLEWRPESGIVTMSLYGDNHVTVVAILGNQREIAGTCSLSDNVILPAFLTILRLLFL